MSSECVIGWWWKWSDAHGMAKIRYYAFNFQFIVNIFLLNRAIDFRIHMPHSLVIFEFFLFGAIYAFRCKRGICTECHVLPYRNNIFWQNVMSHAEEPQSNFHRRLLSENKSVCLAKGTADDEDDKVMRLIEFFAWEKLHKKCNVCRWAGPFEGNPSVHRNV